MNGPRTDGPRTNREPAELDRKIALLQEPHIAPLTEHVERLRAARGADRVPTIECPHPSPQNLNTRPHFRPLILEALPQAKDLANSST